MKHKHFFLILLALALSRGVFGQRMQRMDFRNQQITDILMTLAEVSGTSIIADETVDGSASFHFTDSEFEESLDIFLASYNLFYTRDNNTIRVSRIQGAMDGESGLVTLRAREVEVETLLRTLARIWNTTILHDPLPRVSLSVDIDGLRPEQVLDILIERLPEFTLETKDSYY
jgi:type II secretory pathway component GspD/PulD (secretin)